ncbi:hypothetical protein P775_01590 [Puniceibacterium antarcticum]|uniref:Uncharacterized protein n=1 Tax=Puniceibacterium antarcticum TaxID=1206336 RepID=A0A2G8RLC3_9RHOB|nr:hypothetical protein P775_01590 [Puniceibacterium antarcticum]
MMDLFSLGMISDFLMYSALLMFSIITKTHELRVVCV